ncbi:MAG TPA: hypothetical protein VHF89_05240 [Solirubrobacteraceae bacterium]|nr:hypothetical protein [Solirubrobacteraceae bacterium]
MPFDGGCSGNELRSATPSHRGAPAVTSIPPADDRGTPDPALEALEAALAQRELPRGFSEPALDLLFERQAEFLEDVGLEAIRRARRGRSDFVSAADVERADEAVRGASPSRRAAWLEALGGVFAGGGLGEFVDVLSDEDPAAVAIALPAVLMVVGAVLLTAALLRR